jgi:hypothetical protein
MKRLLKEVKKDRDLSQAVIGEGPPPVLYLNCRGKNITSPQQFADAIRELVTKDAGLIDWWKGVESFLRAINVGVSPQVDLGYCLGQ